MEGDDDLLGCEIDWSLTSPVDGAVLDLCCRTVGFLRHWPVKHLTQNPHACMFHYFNRGQVLVRDSNNSDWIYIVKSGSLSVIKKLHHVDVTDDGLSESDGSGLRLSQRAQRKRKKGRPGSPPEFRNSMEASRRLEQTLPGVFNAKERLGSIDYDRIISDYHSRILQKGTLDTQRLKLPPIAQVTGNKSREGGGTFLETPAKETSTFDADAALNARLKSIFLDSADEDVAEGENKAGSSSSKASTEAQVYQMNIEYQRKFREHVGRKTMADQLDFKGARDFRYTEMDLNPMFVLVQVLEKGQYFGVSQLVYPEQPSLSLVSNGAELVVLSKKLFLDHCSDRCMGYLRRTESPYPAEEKLQGNLQDYVNWEAHRTGVYGRQVSGLLRKKILRKQFLPRVPPGSYNFRSGV